MKKKGFTLVELLAVIAILAILVIIALPNVLKMFTNAKKNTFKDEVQIIYKQAQTDFIQDSLRTSGPRYYCSGDTVGKDGTSKSNCKNLNLTTTKEYYIEMDSAGNINYLGVKDKSFVYSENNLNSVNDISDSDINDINNGDIELGGNTSTETAWDKYYYYDPSTYSMVVTTTKNNNWSAWAQKNDSTGVVEFCAVYSRGTACIEVNKQFGGTQNKLQDHFDEFESKGAACSVINNPGGIYWDCYEENYGHIYSHETELSSEPLYMIYVSIPGSCDVWYEVSDGNLYCN